MTKADDIEGEFGGKSDKAEIYIDTPSRREISKDRKIRFTGYVLSDEDIKLVAKDGNRTILEFMRMTKDGSIPVTDPATGEITHTEPGYRFDENLNLKEGFNDILFEVTDKKTGEFIDSVKRAILVDSQLPIIENISYKQADNSNDVDITMTVKEQVDYFRVYVQGSQVYTNQGDYDFTKPEKIEKTVTFTAKNMRPESKELLIEVVDVAGNKQTERLRVDLTNKISVNKDDLNNLFRFFKALNIDEFNHYSKEYIKSALAKEAEVTKAQSKKEVEDLVDFLESRKAALVKIEEEKAIKIDFQQKSYSGFGGEQLIQIIPKFVFGNKVPSKYFDKANPSRAKMMGEDLTFPASTKKIILTFTSDKDLPLYDLEEDVKVDTIDLPYSLSISYISSSVTTGKDVMVIAKLAQVGKDIPDEVLSFTITDSKGVKRVDKEEHLTNFKGNVTFTHKIEADYPKGIYQVEVSYPKDSNISPVTKNFTVK